jgi:hypothetical protein
MCRSGNDDQLFLSRQLRIRSAIQLHDAVILAADEQQRGRLHASKRGSGEVRSSTTGHHCLDCRPQRRRRLQRRRRVSKAILKRVS